ncbi:S1 family peptidase [Clavibacter michiganensis]|uniref:S1 family peptidase n=1 Tax=Clavibacter michiganensis TaxID=28447 RepID=UPI001BDF94F7|nr:S1 family peptidase [Clavibacter michiganensis]MBT1634764.1 hypothetical protein [Clavibacter michiganensis]
MRRLGLWGRLSSALVILALVSGLGMVGADRASATEPERLNGDRIVGGTQLQVLNASSRQTKSCTAGFVLTKRGLRANATPYERATRYVTTTAHCGDRYDRVDVNGHMVGEVSWVSNAYDMMIVTVPPKAVPMRHHTGSGSHTVYYINYHYEPRAFSAVLTYSQRLRAVGAVPVLQLEEEMPASVNWACHSGATTDYSCLWSKYGNPGAYLRTLRNSLSGAAPGDSGAPIFSDPNADGADTAGVTVYGILHGGMVQSQPHYDSRVMYYVPLTGFISEMQYTYALAPSS